MDKNGGKAMAIAVIDTKAETQSTEDDGFDFDLDDIRFTGSESPEEDAQAFLRSCPPELGLQIVVRDA